MSAELPTDTEMLEEAKRLLGEQIIRNGRLFNALRQARSAISEQDTQRAARILDAATDNA